MKNTALGFLLFLGLYLSCEGQNDRASSQKVVYHINSNIKNTEADYFEGILLAWKSYLNSERFFSRENPYWNYEEMALPDYSYGSLLMQFRAMDGQSEPMQCTVLGIIPVQKEYYLLKMMFSQTDSSSKQLDIHHIISVYAKKGAEAYQFFNASQYHKEVYENKIFGSINYIIHPAHHFQEDEAEKMNAFNQRMASIFDLSPLSFDYVLANTSGEVAHMMGLDFFPLSYQAVQSGGMADNYNNIIYAGNNSAYYPHEVVHLYTYAKFRGQYHPWVDEGIATHFGGSTGYKLEWHLQKLKAFLEKNPAYPLQELSALESDIPNGEYMTDFRYAIGGYLMRKIYEQEGMPGLFDALQAGRREEDYFRLLKEKLGIEKEEWGKYIRQEMHSLEKIEEEDLARFKY
ncbi:MAG: hypothetical protein AAF696_12880 [Bacteroidota bacterium]